jgi:hypothetical protein
MAVSALERIKQDLGKARAELSDRRKDIQRQIATLQRSLDSIDSDLATIDGFGKRGRGAKAGGGRAASGMPYGGVRTSVFDAIKRANGIKPAAIAAATGLALQQVQNALTSLKKSKAVKVRDRLYFAV